MKRKLTLNSLSHLVYGASPRPEELDAFQVIFVDAPIRVRAWKIANEQNVAHSFHSFLQKFCPFSQTESIAERVQNGKHFPVLFECRVEHAVRVELHALSDCIGVVLIPTQHGLKLMLKSKNYLQQVCPRNLRLSSYLNHSLVSNL